MNAEWNTPPDGDFARYVERLTAQMALPRPELQQAPNVIDAQAEQPGITAHQIAAPVAPAARAALAAPQGALNAKALRGVLVVAVVLMVVLNLLFDVSVFVLAMVALALAWILFTLRGVFTGRGTAALREQIERAARQAGRRS